MTDNHSAPQVGRRHYDVVIVGSGAGGSTLAYQLSQYGIQVLVVEQGSFLRPQWDSAARPVGIYKRRFADARGNLSPGVGGDTKFYGAALYRLREDDFRAVEHEQGVSPAWPFGYSDLEPYYERAELLYRVHGSAEGDPTEPPRRRPFPYPPIGHAPFMSQLVARIERSGVRVASVPLGIDYGPNGKCVLCSTCDGHYCRLDAKMDAEVAALRPALADGNVQVMTDTECERVLTTEEGSRVVGVSLRRNGGDEVVHADVVAICAGVAGTPSILLRSRTQKHPRGLGNASGCLGKYLAGHSVGLLFPFVGGKKIPPTFTKTMAINGYYNGAPGWSYPTGVIQVAGQMPIWEDVSKLMRPFVRFVATRALTCFCMTEALPSLDSGFSFEDDKIVGRVPPLQNLKTFFRLRELAIDIFQRAGLFVLGRLQPPRVWHEVGTARLGADPSTSVVDPCCQVHGVEGLFVLDASVLPSAGAVNPALTIIALALRAGDHIGRAVLNLRSGDSTRI